MRITIHGSLAVSLLAAATVTGCSSPKPTPPAPAPPVVVKQDTDWKYSAIADSETQSSRDAQAMAKRNVYDKAARWAESIMPRVRERFALTDTADMLAYLNLAKDDAITSLSMRVKTYDYGRTQFESVVRVKPETVHDTFRRYLVGGARYVTPAERPAYREWCINQVRLP